jgi:DNA-binding response OmpR family regulator
MEMGNRPTPRGRILLIEDEPLVAKAYSRFLEREGYEVTCSESGPDGVEAALGNDFHVCLLNVILPGLDGYQVAERLRAAGNGTPLIFLTGTPREEVESKLAELDIEALYLEKPSSRTELKRTVEGVMGMEGRR